MTLTQDFTIRVMPSNKTIISLRQDVTFLNSEAALLPDKISKLKSKGEDTAEIEALYERFKSTLSQAEDYIKEADYYNAAILANEAEGSLSQLKSLIEAPTKIEEVIRRPIEKGELYNVGVVLIPRLLQLLLY